MSTTTNGSTLRKKGRGRPTTGGIRWSEVKDLGVLPDSALANRHGVTVAAVSNARRVRGIPAPSSFGDRPLLLQVIAEQRIEITRLRNFINEITPASVECVECGAALGQKCTTATGSPADTHHLRGRKDSCGCRTCLGWFK